jgi:hypothetical protein
MIRGRRWQGKVQRSLLGRHRRLWARTGLGPRQDVEQERLRGVADAVGAVAGEQLARQTARISLTMRPRRRLVSAAVTGRLSSMAES